jgi:hypothetical protein
MEEKKLHDMKMELKGAFPGCDMRAACAGSGHVFMASCEDVVLAFFQPRIFFRFDGPVVGLGAGSDGDVSRRALVPENAGCHEVI